jgi:uncharacterized membrane protein YfcA
MAGFIDFLTQAPGVTLPVLAGMSVLSFFASVMATGLGLGGGQLVIAVMTLLFPPAVLIPLHGVVQLGSNISRSWLMRRYVILAVVPLFLGGSLIGAVIGTRLVISLPIPVLQMVLAAFILYAAWAPALRGGKSLPAKFFALGVVGSIITMFVGATGPLVAPFSAGLSPDRHQVVATHAVLMTIQHGLKIAAFGMLGFAFWPYVPLLTGMLVCGFFGNMAGRRVLTRMPEKHFRLVFRLVLSALALRLLYGAIGALVR